MSPVSGVKTSSPSPKTGSGFFFFLSESVESFIVASPFSVELLVPSTCADSSSAGRNSVNSRCSLERLVGE